jgi:hypothetical protein
MRRQKKPLSIVLMCALLNLWAGCSTSFKYTPSHVQTYAQVSRQAGLAIRTGEDLRPDNEREPGWAKDAEPIVARALAEEVRHAKLFNRVKTHADGVNPAKYSEIVQFRVKKFECVSDESTIESAGRTILRMQGIRGALIDRSIPTKYNAEVEVEFAVLDGSTRQPLFAKSYAASRSVTLNGYQNSRPKIQQTSTALEEVLTAFVADLVKIR